MPFLVVIRSFFDSLLTKNTNDINDISTSLRSFSSKKDSDLH